MTDIQRKTYAYRQGNLEAAAVVLEDTEKYGGEEALLRAVGQACLEEARDDRSK